MAPSVSFLPTTTISGTPISSESLNFTPGETPLRSSSSTRNPPCSSSAAIRSAASSTASSLPVATMCTSNGETSRGQISPRSSWCCSAIAATARETPIP